MAAIRNEDEISASHKTKKKYYRSRDRYNVDFMYLKKAGLASRKKGHKKIKIYVGSVSASTVYLYMFK